MQNAKLTGLPILTFALCNLQFSFLRRRRDLMPKTIQGDLTAKGLKVAIVASRFNDFITAKLLDGAIDGLMRHGALETDIEIVKVPGAFEIPLAARMLAQSRTQ